LSSLGPWREQHGHAIAAAAYRDQVGLAVAIYVPVVTELTRLLHRMLLSGEAGGKGSRHSVIEQDRDGTVPHIRHNKIEFAVAVDICNSSVGWHRPDSEP